MSPDEKIEIVICLGSSCFSRGNKNILKVINQYLNEHRLTEKVYFRGGHCFGKCDQGPFVKIGEKIFDNVSPTNILEILESALLQK